jgi:hypothetical protein
VIGLVSPAPSHPIHPRVACPPLSPPQCSAAGGAPPPGTVRLTYRTQFAKQLAHRSVAGGTWATVPMKTIPSSGGKWCELLIPLNGATSSNGHPLVEFAVCNEGAKEWDNNEGKNYTISAPGTWALRRGNLEHITNKKPYLIVSDLDGTLVGDDESLETFKGDPLTRA